MEINVIAEPWCKEQLNDLLGKHQAAAGLIIGQVSKYDFRIWLKWKLNLFYLTIG